MRAAALQQRDCASRTVLGRCNWRLLLALAANVALWFGLSWALAVSGAI